MQVHSLLNAFITPSTNTVVRRRIISVVEGLKGAYQRYGRWWNFPLQPSIPEPQNVKYECDASLGDPSPANCEGALFQLINSGNVTVDPAAGPIIKTSGMFRVAVLRHLKVAGLNLSSRNLCNLRQRHLKARDNMGHAARSCRKPFGKLHQQPAPQRSRRHCICPKY